MKQILKSLVRALDDNRTLIDRVLFFAAVGFGSLGLVLGAAYGAEIAMLTALFLFLFFGYVFANKHGAQPVPPLEEILERKLFRVSVPDRNELDEAIQIAATFFGAQTIDRACICALHEKSPQSILIIRELDTAKIVGYLDIYGVRDLEFMNKFVSGEIDETDFVCDNFVSLDEFQAGDCLYIGAVAIDQRNILRRGHAAQSIIHAALCYLDQTLLRKTQEFDAYSVAYTQAGKALLERLNFALVNHGSARKDRGYLFKRKLSRTSIGRVLRDFQVAVRYYELAPHAATAG